MIHPTAIIHPTAQLAPDVEVGPYCVIGQDVVIGAGTRLSSHVVIEDFSRLGERCQVASGAVIGGLPQDLGFQGERSYAVIGNDVVIREYVTVNRASGEEAETVVEDGVMLMAYSHLGHNSRVGARAILANNVHLGGHVVIGERAFIGGMCVVHQHCRIGRLCMVSGFTGTRQDMPPFAMMSGRPATVRGINRVGLKRSGFSPAERDRVKRAFGLLWSSELSVKQAIEHIRETFEPDPNIEELLQFVESSRRGIRHPRIQSLDDEEQSLEPVG
jgi:UDP-N-acetylglucosamine acyltransferase